MNEKKEKEILKNLLAKNVESVPQIALTAPVLAREHYL